jgi:CRISPR-associated protein (TIGR03984 family)
MTALLKTKLIRRAYPGVSAKAVIDLCHDHDGLLPDIGYAYTPQDAVLFKRQGTILFAALLTSGQVETGQAFELRLLNEHVDMHWVRSGTTGCLTITTERADIAELASKNGMQALASRPDDVEYRDHSYLLWGKAEGASDSDGTTLTTARIGPLWAPLTGVDKGGRAVIRAREYFATFEFGNVCWVGERLLGLAPCKSRLRSV